MHRRRRASRPNEYVVYTDRPAYPRTGCKVYTMKIPRGRTYDDVRDFLPPTVGRLAVVRAYDAATAREYAAKVRGVRCPK